MTSLIIGCLNEIETKMNKTKDKNKLWVTINNYNVISKSKKYCYGTIHVLLLGDLHVKKPQNEGTVLTGGT